LVTTTFEVVETFEIAGRGLVVVLPDLFAALPHVTPIDVTIRPRDLAPFRAQAFHELLLRGAAGPEVSALVLPGVEKAQVDAGAMLDVETDRALAG
jgi:hypothetical protein